MSFTFQTDGEGFNVQIFLKTTLLKESLVKSARSHGWACYVQYFCIWRDEMWVKFWNFKSFQFSSLHPYTWCDTWGFRSLVNKLRTWRSQPPLEFGTFDSMIFPTFPFGGFCQFPGGYVEMLKITSPVAKLECWSFCLVSLKLHHIKMEKISMLPVIGWIRESRPYRYLAWFFGAGNFYQRSRIQTDISNIFWIYWEEKLWEMHHNFIADIFSVLFNLLGMQDSYVEKEYIQKLYKYTSN